uniref:Uncharacterized protein n=1 Tax=Oryza meridionalis TaxID=40149 RepID=A0A0E0CLT6_9ORYZ
MAPEGEAVAGRGDGGWRGGGGRIAGDRRRNSASMGERQMRLQLLTVDAVFGQPNWLARFGHLSCLESGMDNLLEML